MAPTAEVNGARAMLQIRIVSPVAFGLAPHRRSSLSFIGIGFLGGWLCFSSIFFVARVSHFPIASGDGVRKRLLPPKKEPVLELFRKRL